MSRNLWASDGLSWVVSAFLVREDGADRVPYTNILRGLLTPPGGPMSKKCRDLFRRGSALPTYLLRNN